MKNKFSILALIACLSLLSACHAASAAEVYGTVDALTGSASVAGQDGQSAPITVGLHIYEGDTLTSAHDGEVHIVTEDGGIIALRPDTVFRVDEYKAEGGDNDKTFVSLLTGAFRSVTGWIGKHNMRPIASLPPPPPSACAAPTMK